MRAKMVALAALAAGALVTGGRSSAAVAAADDNERSITGTRTVTVDPDGPPPPFQSTITFTGAGGVVEATSKAPSSAGIGTWSRTDDGHFSITFRKYRFDATGTFIGTTVVQEDDVVEAGSNTYTGHVTTKILDANGAVVSSFVSTGDAERMSD